MVVASRFTVNLAATEVQDAKREIRMVLQGADRGDSAAAEHYAARLNSLSEVEVAQLAAGAESIRRHRQRRDDPAVTVITFVPSNRPKTEPGTPCEVCGKRLSRGLLRHAPWATTCNQPCFMTKVMRDIPAWQLDADRQIWEDQRAGGAAPAAGDCR